MMKKKRAVGTPIEIDCVLDDRNIKEIYLLDGPEPNQWTVSVKWSAEFAKKIGTFRMRTQAEKAAQEWKIKMELAKGIRI